MHRGDPGSVPPAARGAARRSPPARCSRWPPRAGAALASRLGGAARWSLTAALEPAHPQPLGLPASGERDPRHALRARAPGRAPALPHADDQAELYVVLASAHRARAADMAADRGPGAAERAPRLGAALGARLAARRSRATCVVDQSALHGDAVPRRQGDLQRAGRGRQAEHRHARRRASTCSRSCAPSNAPVYGPFALGTSAYAPTLSEWPGGGVVGIHGTNEPQLIPGRPSHGCVRMRDADIARLWSLIGLGTPIQIT